MKGRADRHEQGTRKVRVMKKDLLFSGVIVIGAFLNLDFARADSSLSRNESVVAASGPTRALLMVEDLKTLLGLGSRDPSSRTSSLEQDAPAAQAAFFSINISQVEKGRLSRKIAQIENKRSILKQRLEKQLATKRAQLQVQRRELQVQRISTDNSRDTELAKRLFNSLIEEANLEATLTRELNDFDVSHKIQIEYLEDSGTRRVTILRMGSNTLWAATGGNQLTPMVAQN